MKISTMFAKTLLWPRAVRFIYIYIYISVYTDIRFQLSVQVTTLKFILSQVVAAAQ